MLSYIYQIAYHFEHTHELRPNTLYLNQEHFEHLRNEFADPDDIDAISNYLAMHLILSRDSAHPHVAHHRNSWINPISQRTNHHQTNNSQQMR